MKSAAIQNLRRKLAADETVYGLWITLESAAVTEMAVALGLDWVVIDAEHGQLDWQEIAGHVRSAVRSDTVALVRVADLDQGLIKRALDVGADGVVIPWIETADQLRRAIAYSRYPPEGRRGIGAERATGWGECIAEHTAEANDPRPGRADPGVGRGDLGGRGGWPRSRARNSSSSARPTSPPPPGIAASGKGRAWPTRSWP